MSATSNALIFLLQHFERQTQSPGAQSAAKQYREALEAQPNEPAAAEVVDAVAKTIKAGHPLVFKKPAPFNGNIAVAKPTDQVTFTVPKVSGLD
jgi:hypothetical protein